MLISDISVCIITRDQEEKLRRCLKALAPYSWEIVVVDTGSSDKSRETALEEGAKLFEFRWIDDFSAAKNFAASKATNDIILFLDSDEALRPFDADTLVKEIEACPGGLGRIKCVNSISDGTRQLEEYISRIYDRRLWHYEGRIHEQLTGNESPLFYESCLVMDHDGYSLDPEEMEKKTERNRRLLLAELKDAPEDAYILYQLGKTEYFAGEYDKAAVYLGRALEEDIDPALSYISDCVESYGYSLIKCGRAEDALAFVNIYEFFGHTADFQFLMGLIYMNNGLFDNAVEEFEKAAVNPDARARDIGEYSAYFNAGVVRECMGDKESAAAYYRKCGDYEKAKERLKAIGFDT